MPATISEFRGGVEQTLASVDRLLESLNGLPEPDFGEYVEPLIRAQGELQTAVRELGALEPCV